MEQRFYDGIINKYTELVAEIAAKKAEIKIDFKNRNGKYHTDTKIKKGLKAYLLCDAEVTTNLIIEPQKEKIKELAKQIRILSNKLIPISEEINKLLDKNGFVDNDKIKNIQINKDNIYLCYEFMSFDDILNNLDLLNDVLFERYFYILNHFKKIGFINEDKNTYKSLRDWEQIYKHIKKDGYKYYEISFFGIKDTLKPIDEYIVDIKNHEAYKSYIAKVS